jgi:hypothetical protein
MSATAPPFSNHRRTAWAARRFASAPSVAGRRRAQRERSPSSAASRFSALAAVALRLQPSGIAPTGPAFEERVIELSLMEEEVVVSKRIVPRERVRLGAEIGTTDKPIEAVLRQEEVGPERTPVLTEVSATGTAVKNADA